MPLIAIEGVSHAGSWEDAVQGSLLALSAGPDRNDELVSKVVSKSRYTIVGNSMYNGSRNPVLISKAPIVLP